MKLKDNTLSNIKYIITDIETDGLLDTVSKFWCAYIYDSETDSYTGFKDLTTYVGALEYYARLNYFIIGHNFINYDIPALKILTHKRFTFDPKEHVIDTLVLSRLFYSNIKDTDVGLMKRGILPTKLYGRQSLKSWGYRLGELKGTYGESEEAWDKFTEEMYKYNKQDVAVTLKLFNMLQRKDYSTEAIRLEHEIAWVMAKQERNGFCFDLPKASNLYAELVAKRDTLSKTLVETFGSWQVYLGDKVYKRDNAKRNIKAGVPYPQYKEVTFNPSSGAHVAKVLQEKGWKPVAFTPTGLPKTDEQALETAMDIPETALILEYLLVNKRISQLAEGDNAWLKLYVTESDGVSRIHGSVNPNGAVTGRATHSSPNLAQVPAVGSTYGGECRELFCVPKGWYQAGIDASGLELRCFGHFLYHFDKGAYCHEILNGDIHTANQKAAGLPTRNNAKTFIYGFLYGAGDAKIGTIVGGSSKEGKRLKEKFLEATPAIKDLRDTIEKCLISASSWVGNNNLVTWRKRKHKNIKTLDATHCLIGLDGRLLYVRSPHSALNTLLQSAGALICKKWVVETERLLREKGYKHGYDGDFAFMAWVHKQHCAL